jgi:hypothetical protein
LNYYEDFGLPPTASPEQIREAYKILVRLLHPDQQTDPALKRAAEIQMRRINHAYAVLSDPAQRRNYQTEQNRPSEPLAPLVIRPPKPVVVLRPEPRRNSLIWIAVAIGSLGILLWLATQSQPRPGHAAVAAPAPAPAPVPLRKEEPPAAPRVYEPPPAKMAASPAPPQPQPVVESVPASKGFTGHWSYPREKRNQRSSGLYSPVFIEASIVDEDGNLHGKYRARYNVSDRPISPYVNFEFEGKADGESMKLPWHGDGGSQGELEIRLLTGDELELVWRATDFGQTLGLASGTAVLTRRPY